MITPCPHCFTQVEIDSATHAALRDLTHFACPACQGAVLVPAVDRPQMQLNLAPGTLAPAASHQSHSPHTGTAKGRKPNRNLLILGTTAILVLGIIALFLASRRSGGSHTTTQNIHNEIIHNSYFQNLIAAGATTERDLEAMAFIRRFENGFIGISREKLTWDQAMKLAQQTGAEIPGIENDSDPSGPAIVKWINTEVPSEIRSTLWVRRDGQPCVLDGSDVLNAAATTRPCKAAFLWRQEPGYARPGSGPWIDLFTGHDVSHWRGDNLESFPSTAWTIENGTLRSLPDHYENLVTREQFRNFELEFEWKLSPGGNSGLIYGSQVFSREFSLIDDAGHPEGRFPKKSSGGLCHVIAPANTKRLNPAGEFNKGRLIVNGSHVEHWINGTKLVEYELGSADLKSLADQTAFKQVADFTQPGPVFLRFQPGNGLQPSARIVWLRNIRIRDLDGAKTHTNTPIKQQIDLLALTDPLKDRVMPGSFGKANEWLKSNGVLRYKSDGRSGKIVPPVAILATSYEVEFYSRRLDGNGWLNCSLPIAGQILPITLSAAGSRPIHNKGGDPLPESLPSEGLFAIRHDVGKIGQPDRITIRFNGETVSDWEGMVTPYLKDLKGLEEHPEFPGQPLLSIFCGKDNYEFTAWTLRVFEGEAKVLRQASASSSQ